MGTLVSVCGIECGACPFFGKSCAGCREVEGRPFWIEARVAVLRGTLS